MLTKDRNKQDGIVIRSLVSCTTTNMGVSAGGRVALCGSGVAGVPPALLTAGLPAPPATDPAACSSRARACWCRGWRGGVVVLLVVVVVLVIGVLTDM